MKKSIYCSELIERDEMKTLLSETGAGLESIRFAISDNLDQLEKNIREMKDDLDFYGNPRLYLHGPFVDLNPMTFDSKIRQVVLDRFNACYEAAVELGADGIVYHSGMVPTVYFTIGWADRMVDFWNEFLEGKSGIPVNMENVLDREVQPFVEVAEKMQHPDFGICLDLGHAHCNSDFAAGEWLEKAFPYIRHLHLHDNDGSADQHWALGKGTIPYEELFLKLKDLPDETTVTLECQRLEDFRSSIRTIKEHM